MSDLFDLKGKAAVVTGGSGGIGSALALGLAEAGADVVVTSRGLEKLEPIAKQIKDMGRKSLAVSCDITDEASVAKMVAAAVKELGKIDILVNAAGKATRKAPEEMALADWQEIMDFNAKGTFILCKAVGQQMIKQGNGGKIVLVSSVRGSFGADGAIAYAPSKSSVDSMTRVLALEWAKHKILVNAIAPAVVETELTRPLLANPDTAKMLVGRTPLGRLVHTEDLVGPAVFLSGKASDFITGQILFVDGGTYMW